MRRWHLLLPLALGACSTGEASRMAEAVRDTLPGDIERVMSPGPTAQADTLRPWRLVASDTLRAPAGSAGELIHPQDLAVGDDGTVYVADAGPATIKVFTRDGRFVRTIGREGEGPGEYRIPIVASAGEHLLVHDVRIGRTSVFDTAGTYLRAWRSVCCVWMATGLDRTGVALVPAGASPGEPIRYLRYNLDGSFRDTLLLPAGPTPKTWTFTSTEGGRGRSTMTMTVPLSARRVFDLHPDGGVVFGTASDFTLVRSPSGSDSAMVFGRPWAASPIPDSVRSAAIEQQVASLSEDWSEAQLRDAMRSADVPTEAPPYSHVSVDGLGRTWVRLGYDDGTTPPTWDLFGADGAWLGRVASDAYISRYGPQAWDGETLVTILEDDDGFPRLVRFTLDRGDS